MSNTNIQSEVLPSSASPNEAKSSYDPPMSASDLQRLLSLDDLQDAARKYLDKALYEYFASGTEDEQTLSLNRLAFKQILLKPRVMRNVSTLDTSCFVLGSQRRARLPIFVSPAGVHSLCDGGVPGGGELSTARIAGETKVVMASSQHATQPLEAVAEACPADTPGKWFQVYFLKDRSITQDLVCRAIAAGYTAIVVTVDSVIFGSREADARNNFIGLPPGMTLANYAPYRGDRSAVPFTSPAGSTSGKPEAFEAHFDDRTESRWDQNTEKMFAQDATWEDVTWLKSLLKGKGVPLLVKGILRGDDAVCAIEAGADGIIVSNHGGRQLDGSIPAIEALPSIVRAVRFYRADRQQRYHHPHNNRPQHRFSREKNQQFPMSSAQKQAKTMATNVDIKTARLTSGNEATALPMRDASNTKYLPHEDFGTVECFAEEVYPVYVDGGVRRGTDVLKALALGAAAVLIGKPLFFSLGVGGEDGLRRMFAILESELRAAMKLCGCSSIADIRNTPDLVCIHRNKGHLDTGYMRSSL